MKTRLMLAGTLAVSLAAVTACGAFAQTVYPMGQSYTTHQTTTTTQAYPTNSVQTVSPGNLSGNVENEVTSEGGWLWLGSVEKTVNMTEPIAGQFTHDDLAVGRRLILTLVNPTDNPMQFETSQRIGQEYSWVVQPQSQKRVSFIYTKPFSDEVKFLVSDLGIPPATVTMRRQAEALAAQGATIQSQQTTISSQQGTIQSQASALQNSNMRSATEPSMVESQSAVRGYW
jgi:hypothetical protein